MRYDRSLLESFAKTARRVENAEARCLIGPPNECSDKIIKAHSIQEAKLRLIADKRHKVLIMTPDPSKTVYRALQGEPQLAKGDYFFERRTIRNRLLTARMACERHDNQIFAMIEDSELDPNQPEHCALLSYRAVLFELHKKQVLNKVLDSMSLIYPFFHLGSDFMADGVRAAERVKSQLERDIFSTGSTARSSTLEHRSFAIESEPRVAATTIVRRDGPIPPTPRELEEIRRTQVPRYPQGVPIIVTVYPEPGRQIAVASFPRGSESLARIIVPAIAEPSDGRAAALLSKSLLEEAENIVVSTKAWENFGDAKRQRIREQFMATIPAPRLVPVPTGVTTIPEQLMSEIAYAHEPDFVENCDPGELNLFG